MVTLRHAVTPLKRPISQWLGRNLAHAKVAANVPIA